MASPTTILILRGKDKPDALMGHLQGLHIARGEQILHGNSRTVDRRPLVVSVLIAEPERRPAAIGSLGAGKPTQELLFAFGASPPQPLGQARLPKLEGEKGMRRYVGTAPVERKLAPALTKGRHTAILVPQRQKPLDPGTHFVAICPIRQEKQSHQSARRIVGIRHRTL